MLQGRSELDGDRVKEVEVRGWEGSEVWDELKIQAFISVLGT